MPPKPSHNIHGVDSNTTIRIDYDLCMGCGACARTCDQSQEFHVLTPAAVKFPPNVNARDGNNAANTETTRVKFDDSNCVGCGQCLHACSFNAISPASRWAEVEAAKAAGKVLIAVVAPSTRVGIAEAMGMEPGLTGEKQMIQGLHDLGFKYVFDNQWGADTCTIEDAKEVLHMKHAGHGPCYTSCCPAWINLVETKYPELIPHISTARSPHGMICSTIKKHWCKDVGLAAKDLYVVGFMPCTAKKAEAARKQLATDNVADCEVSVTSKELADLFKSKGIAFSAAREEELKATTFDAPFNEFSGSAYIFGKTAGVTESVVRYIQAINKEKITMEGVKAENVWTHKDGVQSITKLTFSSAGVEYVAVVSHGGAAAQEVIKRIHQEKSLKCDVVEVMICPMGCQNGGGQPRQVKKNLIPERAKALDKHDAESKYLDCEHNTAMHEYLKKHLSNEQELKYTFHTYYEDRSKK